MIADGVAAGCAGIGGDSTSVCTRGAACTCGGIVCSCGVSGCARSDSGCALRRFRLRAWTLRLDLRRRAGAILEQPRNDMEPADDDDDDRGGDHEHAQALGQFLCRRSVAGPCARFDFGAAEAAACAARRAAAMKSGLPPPGSGMTGGFEPSAASRRSDPIGSRRRLARAAAPSRAPADGRAASWDRSAFAP